MLDIEVLKINHGVSYGSVTLKSLQNDNVPELDLLVREAIQNSSDAALQEPGKYYAVNFSSGSFVPRELNQYLTSIDGILDARYPELTATFLEIRDTKTCGLTGCIRRDEIISDTDDHGNFFKLIYDTGKRQTKSLAGGNWGFGKSVYYRVGIGIVIFYSRIKTEDKFEDRLIITLVEDESKKDSSGNDATILKTIEPLSAGKAWWGIEEGEDLLPLQDMEFIQPILDVFHIPPFKENETGTSIIIPYVDTHKLLSDIIPVESDIEESIKTHFLNVWGSTVSDYIRLSIQKWYAPKIHNRELQNFCENKWLRVSVDNIPISKNDLLPFFELVQELYTTALAKTYSVEYQCAKYPQIVTLPINIRSYFNSGMTAGYLALIRINSTDLNGTQNLLSPYDYIGKFEADGGLNEPIIMYARDPGMVIEYAITGAWVKNVPAPESPDEFLFGFFVPETDKTIKTDLAVPEYAGMKLGEYFRACEASDHMGWNDPVKMQIVQRIQKNIINQINNHIKANEVVRVDATASKLANRLGRNLLPKIGYGKTPGGGSGGGSSGGTKVTNASLEITSQTIRGNEVEMDFRLKLMHNKKNVRISIMIASEGGWINAESWAADIGTPFPVTISNCFIDTLKTPISDHPIVIAENCNTGLPNISHDELEAALETETEQGSYTQISFASHLINPEISGCIKLVSYDKKYQFIFRIE